MTILDDNPTAELDVEGDNDIGDLKKRRRLLRRWDWWESIDAPKYVTAPMVDQSELAFRMMTREYGAGLAYTPMINSKVFATSQTYRRENFYTAPGDDPLIAQFNGDDPEILVESARYIQHQVSAVDINFGCPQGIARKGHYGSFLLEEPSLCVKLVDQMVSQLDCPVTVKMRLVNVDDPGFQDTINLISQFDSAGVDMICIHTRTKEMKKDNTGPAIWSAARLIKDRFKSFPIVCNGGIGSFDDVIRCMEETGCDAVMSSEAILEKPDLFSPDSRKSQVDLAKEYLEYLRKYPVVATRWEVRCAKSHMFRFLYAGLQRHVDLRDKLGVSKSLDEIEQVLDELTNRRAEEPVGLFQDLGWYNRHRPQVSNAI
jgi:tRNA-dihydrouridine synthase